MNLQSQRGGTFLGFIIGLVLGLGVALAVAVYVTKVPTPFSNKNQPRTNDQNVQENQKNKDWNPNGVLQPKAPAEQPVPATGSSTSTESRPEDKSPAPSVSPQPEAPRAEPRPAVTADPLGDLAKNRSGLSTPANSTTNTTDPFDYVVQAGAFRTSADADAQKAKLAMMGLDAKVSERDQAGRAVYRVRLGPFTDKAAAERIQAQLSKQGIDNTLVRLQR
jgi:cell division protein FtsN